jgi:SAM-dependent methyltransferase
MYIIPVKSKDRTLYINVSNVDVYKHYQKLQQTPTLRKSTIKRIGFIPTDDIDQNIFLLYNNYWRVASERKWYDNLPKNPKVLDIGSGIGFLDFLAYQYLDNTGKFFLLDANKRTRFIGKDTYSVDPTKHGFYNSWAVSKDIINSTELDPNDFVFLDIDDSWPEIKFDLITSFSSWCWHYPLTTYWGEVKQHLKIGGKLILTISSFDEEESNVIETISKEFNSTPVKVEDYSNTGTETDTINRGFRCCWIRQ